MAASSSRKRKLKAAEVAGTEGEEGVAEAHDYASLAHRIFAALRVGGVEGVCGAVAAVVADGYMAGSGAAAAAVVVVAENTAVLVVAAVDHTYFEQQELAAVELGLIVERMAAQIQQRPEVDKGCIAASQGVEVAVAERAPVAHVAVAVAVAAAAAVVAAAIGNFVSHRNHNLHTEQIALVEGAEVRALAVGLALMATVGCNLVALEAGLLLQL